uniref:hypothetical protein n=1 Tax=Amycolatopsis sp. CA-096443 TaxID=3239919 RepID=UPI003F4961A1
MVIRRNGRLSPGDPGYVHEQITLALDGWDQTPKSPRRLRLDFAAARSTVARHAPAENGCQAGCAPSAVGANSPAPQRTSTPSRPRRAPKRHRS